MRIDNQPGGQRMVSDGPDPSGPPPSAAPSPSASSASSSDSADSSKPMECIVKPSKNGGFVVTCISAPDIKDTGKGAMAMIKPDTYTFKDFGELMSYFQHTFGPSDPSAAPEPDADQAGGASDADADNGA